MEHVGLTPKQAQVLGFVARYMDDHPGVAPSYDEIAAHFAVQGRGSRGSVKAHIDNLIERGYLSKMNGRPRSLTILKRIDRPAKDANGPQQGAGDGQRKPDHLSYFDPLPDPRAEALAAHLFFEWQEHEAAIAGWAPGARHSWAAMEPDQKRGYRAMAIAASQFFSA